MLSLGFLSGLGNFFNSKTIQYIVIGGAIFLASLFIYKFYGVIKENGENRIIIENLEQNVERQKQALQKMELIIKLNEQSLILRDKQVEKLEKELENATVDLGEDSTDAAPDSIKELFRRLR